MKRHGIFGATALAGVLAGRTAGIGGPGEAEAARADIGDIVVEKAGSGESRKGKVFAAIHAHLDDIPYYCAGTCARFVAEGATGYNIRSTNDDRCGPGSIMRNIKSNEAEHIKIWPKHWDRRHLRLFYRNTT